MKLLTIFAILWALALVALFVFAPVLNEALWILYLPIHWGVPFMGAVLLVVAIVFLARRQRGALPAVIIVLAGLTVFATSGFRWGRLALFQLRKGHYEDLLAVATVRHEIPPGEGYHDEGPPERFAFYWQRGVVDNWAGVVHDPTGEVLHTDRDEVRHLFGGILFKCEPLGGGWYLCWFT